MFIYMAGLITPRWLGICLPWETRTLNACVCPIPLLPLLPITPIMKTLEVVLEAYVF